MAPQRACQAVGVQAAISSDPEAVRQADRVIFPGVGTAESAMTTLEASGLDSIEIFCEFGTAVTRYLSWLAGAA